MQLTKELLLRRIEKTQIRIDYMEYGSERLKLHGRLEELHDLLALIRRKED